MFDPGTLNYATTYYRRIDAVNDGGQSDIAVAEATQAVNKIDNVYKV